MCCSAPFRWPRTQRTTQSSAQWQTEVTCAWCYRGPRSPTYTAAAVAQSLMRMQVSTDEEVVGVGLAGPGPVVDEPPRAQAVDLAELVLVERVLDRGL